MTEEKKINSGGPAFPRSCGQCGSDVEGMSLRDWFSGMALQGLCLNSSEMDLSQTKAPEALAIISFRIADAMIREGEKKP